MKRANSRSRQLSVLASFPLSALVVRKCKRRAALTPKKCPGQLSQVPTLKRLREYGISLYLVHSVIGENMYRQCAAECSRVAHSKDAFRTPKTLVLAYDAMYCIILFFYDLKKEYIYSNR